MLKKFRIFADNIDWSNNNVVNHFIYVAISDESMGYLRNFPVL